MKPRARLLIAASLLLALPPEATAALPPGASERIDRILSEVYRPGDPGAAVIAVKDGEVVFRKGYGMADLEWGIPVEPDMVFGIGSVTKQFTAAAIMMLVEEKKLRLQDSLVSLLPGYPLSARDVTVEHLLTHTSGIKNYTDLPLWRTRMRLDVSVRDLIDSFQELPMDFSPGTKRRYNNSGYVLLGSIIERLSGMSYGEFVKSRILKPLGMTHSAYGDNRAVIPRRVRGYEVDRGSFVNAPYLSMTQPYAAGALLSSVDDLAAWDGALFSGKVVGKESLDKIFTPFHLANGRSICYGYGWVVGRYEGISILEHGGGVNGFRAHVLRLPEHDTYVAILSNNASPERSPVILARTIAGIVISRPFPERVTVALDPATLDRYVGYYKVDEQIGREVTRVGDQLYVQGTGSPRFAIDPIGTDRFVIRVLFDTITFAGDEGGSAGKMVVDQDGCEEIAYRD